MNKLSLDEIVDKGITQVSESSKAFYLWPDTGSQYVSYIYRMDKDTREIVKDFITNMIDDYPDIREDLETVSVETLSE